MATVNLFGDLALDSSVTTTNNKLTALTSTRDTAAASDQKGVLSLAVRRDADTAPVVDGNMAALMMDEEGRLKTSNKTASFAVTTGPIAAIGNTLVADVRRASNVVFHVKNTGSATMTAGTYVFEASIDSTNGSDGTWFSIQAVRSNSNIVEVTNTALGLAAGIGLAYSWESSVNAYQYMRVRCTVASLPATTAVATWTIQRGSYATEPIPAPQASVAAQPVTMTSTTITGTVAATATPLAGTPYPPIVTTASTNATFIKAGVGSLFEVTISNPTATAAYVKLYNKTSAPTVGTDIPVLTIPIPPTGTDAGFKAIEFGALGKRFSTGIAIAVTGAAAQTDTTAAVAGIQISATYV